MLEPLLLLLALALLAIPVAVIYLLLAVSDLKNKVRDLTRRLDEAPGADRAVAATDGTRQDSPQVRQDPRQQDIPDAVPVSPERTPWVGAARKAPAAAPVPSPTPQDPESQAVVFRRERMEALAAWLRENWFYAVAAVSLALSGLFLVQYGMENGLLPPQARVAAALVLGAALIAAGEYIRRRFGDSEDSSAAYLPSVLSSAGLVSLFGGILAARMLYGLIEPGPAMAGLFAVALGGMVLGWFHGPLLAAIGLLGGMAAPFLVGGSSETPEWLLLYFALLSALGLGIDTLRRWAWVSVLALVLGFGAGWMLQVLSAPSDSLALAFAGFAAGLSVMATLIPARDLVPDHGGPCLAETLLRKASWPIFPARLSLGSLLAACLAIAAQTPHSALTYWSAIALVTALGALYMLWSARAPALQDHALLPVLTLMALLGLPDLHLAARDAITLQLQAAAEQTETRMIRDISQALGAALILSLMAAWRSFAVPENRIVWAAAAALIAPAAGLFLDMSWHPDQIIGAYPWALHAAFVAAVMTVLAERFARRDGADPTRASLAALSALACLAFGLGLVLSQSALTLALAATVLAAAGLDRRFDMPLMGTYIAAGVVALGYRLTVDPGLDWATRAPVLSMLLAYGGTLTAFLAALWLLAAMDRPRSRVFLESAAWSTGGMTLSLTLYHAFAAFSRQDTSETHWGFGLYACVWAGVALAQVHRQSLGGCMRYVRIALSCVFGAIAALMMVLALTLANPLVGSQSVIGWPVLNSLIPAYLLPAIILAAGAWRLGTLPRWTRLALGGVSLGLAVFWAALTIRHVWQGGEAMRVSHGVTQPELYSYTVALLLTGALLFYQALARRSDLLRRVGVLVIALAVAKVFLIDISGLSGLVRVFSFLVLGLSLAGLAWFNRWVQTRAGPGPDKDTGTDKLPGV
ncbi:DUF2339 domain-containing protein [Tropicibacter oceani]|uniref:DUF2339 domain-containing protein n=1 Tax=Tropicibacter oceani TaxID=3058420 RepID=A0ABY8QI59_9RHOB|nr:DUF2339 domain-containing protein [Tropicibacter oceani]WGW03691.1 DUF2339 domain-containing protein [Tropicibacter oceani]